MIECGLLLKFCWLWLSFLLVQFHGYLGCLEVEKTALLEIKFSLLSTVTDIEYERGYPLLPSWVDDKGSDCCNWERVKCNPITGRVIELSLSSINVAYSIESWLLNGSLFLPFEDLRCLDLSISGLSDWVKNEGFQQLSKLKNLEILNLYGNHFNNSIASSLGTITSLKTLTLGANMLEGPFPFQALANLTNLKVLDLGFNQLSGNVPQSIGNLTSLKALSLSRNGLSGVFSQSGLCKLKNLEELVLSFNNFEGSVSQCLKNMTSLKRLDLYSKNFQGKIPSSLIASLRRSLEYISLAHNHFEGMFFFSSLANHSKLQVVELTCDDVKLKVRETESIPWVPSFQLKKLLLSNCNLNKPPKFLSYQYDLRTIDLSHNNLKGRFPSWLLENNIRLEHLTLRNNSLAGPFHLSKNIGRNMSWIDTSNNRFSGQLSTYIGEILPNLEYLNISKNGFEGSIPSSIGDMRDLLSLDLSSNHFSGEVPEHLLGGCTSLIVLNLSNNSLSGRIFPTRDLDLTLLTSLYLDNNQFTELSNGLSKCHQLMIVDISNNSISGGIPGWIGNITSLRTLVMRDNHFKGHIPLEFNKLQDIGFLDLSGNSLSGSLPSFLNLTSIQHIHLQRNGFTGLIPDGFLNSSYLLTLDIRENNLHGGIPSSLSRLSDLRVLLLRGNQLTGQIPYHLCQLNDIDIMDLSNNNFSGKIPRCLNNISFGRMGPMDHAFVQPEWFESFGNSLRIFMFMYKLHLMNIDQHHEGIITLYYKQDEVEFATKSRLNSYKGDILNYMSGLDLSHNHLTGDIPHEIGDLSNIHSLNLSHNQLTGSIPKALSKLTQMESLDLSYNKLSGEIPSELADISFLSVFIVAYNNLSGKTPDVKAQFITFGETSYEGNPLLCGPLLKKKCTSIAESLTPTIVHSCEDEENKSDIDPITFLTSFAASYIIFLLGFAVSLYINPYWRRMWFDFIEDCMYSCYNYFSDALYKLCSHLHM